MERAIRYVGIVASSRHKKIMRVEGWYPKARAFPSMALLPHYLWTSRQQTLIILLMFIVISKQ